MIGHRIAHYEIVEKLGEGGMGVVYKAHDLHLQRSVALKVLPADRVGDEERRRRFVQEARAASALNHPNIVTIHDIDFAGGEPYIAMEYVPGQVLERLIGNKGLKVGEALRYAVQIADALAKAHAAGIVHRDLKPANVMVTGPEGSGHPGVVKVLDFGLAKLTEPAGGEAEETRTLQPHTEEGTIVGTVCYMSPEQAQGQKVDARSDIFSFGSMLYEMVTGKRAFAGNSKVSVLGKILHKEPDPIEAAAPPELLKVIQRCLRKDPERRFQHMEDLKVELEEIQEESSSAAPVPRPSVSRLLLRALPWVLAAALGVLLLAFLVRSPRTGTSQGAGVVRFTIDVPQRGLLPHIALSPDGTQLVYIAVEDGKQRLLLRPMDRPRAQAIPGTENARSAIFSPDGQWLLFWDGKTLKRIRPAGGEPSSLMELAPFMGEIGVDADGSILYAGPSTGGGLVRVSGAGGTPQTVSRRRPDQGEFTHAYPEVLPGGKGILFTIARPGLGFGKHSAAVIPTGASEHRVVLDDGYAASYARSGHLVFRRSGVLYTAPFDLNRLATTGAPAVIAEDAESNMFGKGFSVSENGTLAYIKRDPEAGQMTPCWVDRQGNPQNLPAAKDEYGFPALAPDGRRLALTKLEGSHGDIWVWDFAREIFTRTTFEGNNHAAIWAPDGASLVFSSDREGPQANLWRVRADGTGKPERLTTSANHQDPASFSPDGKLLAFAEVEILGGNFATWVLHLDGSGRVEPFLKTRFAEDSPAVSPDGKWIAYTSNESGRSEVYVQRFPAGGAKYQLSTGGGDEALWRPDGKEIYYRHGTEAMAATVTADANFSGDKPRLLFTGNYAPRGGFGHPGWDISRDGKRFLMLKPFQPAQDKPRQIQVVLNWFEELRKSAPAARQP